MRGLETKKSIALMSGVGLVMAGVSVVELAQSRKAKESNLTADTGLHLSKSMTDMGFTTESFGQNAVFADHLAGFNSDKHTYRHCTMVVTRRDDGNQIDFYEAPSMDSWNITSVDIQSVDVVVTDSDEMDGKITIIPLRGINSLNSEGNMMSVFSGITELKLNNRSLMFRVTNFEKETHVVSTST